MASTPDGPRYVASITSCSDLSCYKDFFESEKLEEAKEKADEAALKYQFSALVYDRKVGGIIYKKVIEMGNKEPELKVVPPPRRGRKPKKVLPLKKEITKDDYFE